MEAFYYLTAAGVLGLLVGSFLNVVIYRLPIMLKQQWELEYQLYAASNTTSPPPPAVKTFNLLFPSSHCPHCQKSLPITANIPLISYCVAKGKCLFCKHSISLRYPLIELSTAIISILVVKHFGMQWQSLSALALSWALIVLAAIDFDEQLLPDVITLPLLWLGLLLSKFNLHTNSQDAIIGAAFGYLSLWIVANLFKTIRKKEGMGGGDFKLLAALGAWLGWQPLPAIILIACLLALTSSAALILTKPYTHYRYRCIPFGPYLAVAAWLMLIDGQSIMNAYFHLAAIS